MALQCDNLPYTGAVDAAALTGRDNGGVPFPYLLLPKMTRVDGPICACCLPLSLDAKHAFCCRHRRNPQEY